jgi:Na+/H+-dicarboxylate symporter
MYKLTGIIMALAPYGIFALMAWLAGTQGIQVLLPLLKLVFAVYLTALIHMFIVYGGIIKLFTRFSPVQFFKRILDVILFSYSTSSSSATLPVSMRCAQEKLGISKSITSFVLPLGATINMNGTAIYQGICALFIAQVYGIPLSGTEYSLIIATTVLAAIGTAGVPGAGLIMLSLVLTSAGLPLAGIALIAGIDRILDMARSSVNVVGDIVASLLIAKSEGELKHMPDISSSTAEETEKPVSTSAQL